MPFSDALDIRNDVFHTVGSSLISVFPTAFAVSVLPKHILPVFVLVPLYSGLFAEVPASFAVPLANADGLPVFNQDEDIYSFFWFHAVDASLFS